MKLGSVNVEINGARLREERKLAGLDQATLAEKVGCTGAYISILETKPRRTCSPALFAAICDALGIAAEDRVRLLRNARRPKVRAA